MTFDRHRPDDMPRQRCSCGRWPRFMSTQVAEDLVESWFACSCGASGPVAEDAWTDRATARFLWDQAQRRAA